MAYLAPARETLLTQEHTPSDTCATVCVSQCDTEHNVTDSLDVSEEAIAAGRRLIIESGSNSPIAQRLGLEAYDACPMSRHHYLTLDEVVELLPEGSAREPGIARVRLAKAGVTMIKTAYDADVVLEYLSTTKGRGWRRGQPGGW